MRKLIVLMVASMSMVSFAQQGQQPAPKEIIFDGDVIEGKLDRPDVEYFQPGSHPLQPSLIKVREEFKEKVMQSVGEL